MGACQAQGADGVTNQLSSAQVHEVQRTAKLHRIEAHARQPVRAPSARKRWERIEALGAGLLTEAGHSSGAAHQVAAAPGAWCVRGSTRTLQHETAPKGGRLSAICDSRGAGI